MDWRLLTLMFRHRYEGGYRYLDACGAFILDAERQLDVVPVDMKPAGAKLELPEKGILVSVDTMELRITQETFIENDTSCFEKVCRVLVKLVEARFQPSFISSNTIARRSYVPKGTSNDAWSASLSMDKGGKMQGELGRALGVIPLFKDFSWGFSSGNRDVTVQVAPITFEKVKFQHQVAGHRETDRQKAIIHRRNHMMDNRPQIPEHGLSLNVEMAEYDPPLESFDAHFRELTRYDELVKQEFEK